jgi:hypothetical protein
VAIMAILSYYVWSSFKVSDWSSSNAETMSSLHVTHGFHNILNKWLLNEQSLEHTSENPLMAFKSHFCYLSEARFSEL